MDARRASRMVIDPKVRQVGFFTPGAPPERAQSDPVTSSSPPASEMSPAGNSLSPVMIPPPRHASDNLGSTASAARPIPVPVQAPMSPHRRPSAGESMLLGSYNPSESVLGTSPSPSSRVDDVELSEEMSAASGWIGKSNPVKAAASSFPSGGMAESPSVRASNFPGAISLTKVSVMKMPPGLSEKGGKPSVDVQNERAGVSKPAKEKTSKAERRALQEAQRAAKAAAKNAGFRIQGGILKWWS